MILFYQNIISVHIKNNNVVIRLRLGVPLIKWEGDWYQREYQSEKEESYPMYCLDYEGGKGLNSGDLLKIVKCLSEMSSIEGG